MILVFLLLACTATPLAWPVPRVTVEPDSLGFPAAIFGDTNLASIEVTNHGTLAAALTSSIEEPFLVAETQLEVAAGTTRVLLVSWTPSSYAPASATFTLTGSLTDLSVPVSGEVETDGDGDGFVALGAGGDDCDDAEPGVWPGAPELCDALDNDCDGQIDVAALDARAWFPDDDGDTWGVTSGGVDACSAPSDGWANRGGDCDDTDDAINPDVLEVWYDGVDADCSGGSDEDRDGDGYDNLGTGGSDCQDEDPAVNPGHPEVAANGVDDDCDGETDELDP